MFNNIDRDKLAKEISDLADKVDAMINDINSNPSNPLRDNTKILNLLPMLDFYNGDLRKSAENLRSKDFGDGTQIT